MHLVKLHWNNCFYPEDTAASCGAFFAHSSQSLRLVTVKIDHLWTEDAVIIVISKHTVGVYWVQDSSHHMSMGESDFKNL